MSVQFGRWNLDGKPIDGHYLERIRTDLASYGPDGQGSYQSTNVSILYHDFHTTKETADQTQPCISQSGIVITCDGHLDNRTSLVSELRDSVTLSSTDISIVTAAYERWGKSCFAKLIGDWALSIWDPKNCFVILAKDHIGTRPLYYSRDNTQVSWSSILDPLVRYAGKILALNEEYIAGWLSLFPSDHLSPWADVHSVPASSLVMLRPKGHTVEKYWDFDPAMRVRYRADADYEQHFRVVFATAVRRKLRSDRPVLAELSGGRDSSSIVCMADEILERGDGDTPRLDTVSYYDDSEPNWNERPYFAKIEEKRGRRGCHIDVRWRPSREDAVDKIHSGTGFMAMPGEGGRSSPDFAACLTGHNHRVLLSGIGGDEVMGGVPTPTPELQDLIVQRRFKVLAHQLKVWALQMRRPWLYLLWEASKGFLPPSFAGSQRYARPAPWLQLRFVKQYWIALSGYPSRVHLFGALPSFQENLRTLDGLRRQLACRPIPVEPPFEIRYPYLDRDLLEFMFAIPRAQVIRATERRSLMRRALQGIVPDDILHRKSKAFMTRAPLAVIIEDLSRLVEAPETIRCSALGIVTPRDLGEVLQDARRGHEVRLVSLLRTMCLERWLRVIGTIGLEASTTTLPA